MLADELATQIAEAHRTDLEKRGAERWPARTNIASQIGWPCARKMYFKRTAWQEARPFGPDAIERMDAGNVWEGATIRRLQDLGFETEETQILLDWPEYQIAGKTDIGMLRARGNGRESVPAEIKSLSHYGFQKLDTVADMLDSKTIFYKQYPHQLNLYMLMRDRTSGLFVLRDRESGALKPIPMAVDFDLGQQCLDRAEAVNAAIKSGEPPEVIPWCEWCEACDFLKHCRHPEQHSKPVDIITDPALIEMIEERESLAEAKKRYDSIDRALKKEFKRVVQNQVLAGDFVVTPKEVERKGYVVKASTYTKFDIRRWQGDA